jgi:addiction module HigA family antidote
MALTFVRPIHPGEILREEFLVPLGLTPYSLAKALHIQRPRIEKLVREKTPVTPDTALRLGRYFNTTPDLWLNLQKTYDLEIAAAAKKDEIDLIVPRPMAAA